MVDSTGLVAVILAWVGTWVTERGQTVVPSDCSCNCTCEVAAVTCPALGSWTWELCKLLAWVITGILLGSGHLALSVILGALRLLLNHLASLSAPTAPTTSLTPSRASFIETPGSEDQRDRARQQLELLRQRRAVKN